MKLTDVETGNLPEPQLYDMRRDREEENLATKHPETVQQLAEILKEERAKK